MAFLSALAVELCQCSATQTAAIISRNQTGKLGTIAPNSEVKFEGDNDGADCDVTRRENRDAPNV